jgi:hypothetical protein
MILSKAIRQALEWSEEDDDGLACRPTILGGLAGPQQQSTLPVGLAPPPRVPSLTSLAYAVASVAPPPAAEPRMSRRPTRRAPELTPHPSVRPTGRPSQLPF